MTDPVPDPAADGAPAPEAHAAEAEAAEAVQPRGEHPTPAAAPRPGPAGPAWRRVLAAIFLHDAALKALALVLAILTWQLVRERLETPITVSVRVEVVDVPDDLALVGPVERRVQLSLLGTRAEVEHARTVLEAEEIIKVRMPDAPAGVDEGTAPAIYQPTDFLYPFERTDLVKKVSPPLLLGWVRLAQRTVPVDVPAVAPAPGGALEPAPGWPTLETTKVRVRGPKSVVAGLVSVRPDVIDATAWLETNPDLSTLFSWSSGFDAWRGNDPLRSVRVLSLQPEAIRGKLKFRPVATPRSVEHALQVLLPAGAPDLFVRFDVLVDGGADYDRTTRKLRCTLKGEKRTLDELEANPDGWSLVAEAPPPSDAGEPVENVRVPVRLLLGAAPATGKALGAGVVLDGAPAVSITLRKKP